MHTQLVFGDHFDNEITFQRCKKKMLLVIFVWTITKSFIKSNGHLFDYLYKIKEG